MKKHLVLTALMTALAAPALAQIAPAPAPMMAPMSSAQYRQMAMASDAFEIESSRIALERSRNPAIRNMANVLIEDHSASMAALNGGRPMAGGAAGGAAAGAVVGGAVAGPVGAVVGAGAGAATGAATGGGRMNAMLDPRKADMLNQLASTPPGPRFDRAFLAMQVDAHREAVALHSSYAQSGSDPALRSFAAQVLPGVQAHLAMAQRMTGRRGGGRMAM